MQTWEIEEVLGCVADRGYQINIERACSPDGTIQWCVSFERADSPTIEGFADTVFEAMELSVRQMHTRIKTSWEEVQAHANELNAAVSALETSDMRTERYAHEKAQRDSTNANS